MYFEAVTRKMLDEAQSRYTLTICMCRPTVQQKIGNELLILNCDKIQFFHNTQNKRNIHVSHLFTISTYKTHQTVISGYLDKISKFTFQMWPNVTKSNAALESSKCGKNQSNIENWLVKCGNLHQILSFIKDKFKWLVLTISVHYELYSNLLLNSSSVS